MVTPYLSRLRPVESGPLLRQRARSRFEPAPALPIDGRSIGSLGLSSPPESAAEAADVEIELDQDPPYPHLAGPAVAAAAPGDRGLPPARTAAPQSAAQDEERAPARAARSTTPPLRKPAPAGESHRQAAASAEGDFRPTPVQAADREHAAAPWSATRRSAPRPRHAPPDQAPVLSGQASRGGRPGAEPTPPETAPPERPLPAPHHYVGGTSHSADAPADRVQAMARWLRDADDAAGPPRWRFSPPADRAGLAEPAADDRAIAPWPGHPDVDRRKDARARPDEVTVTIGRIEVRVGPPPAPAGAAAGAAKDRSSRPQPSRLEDYLRARASGRIG